MPDNIDIGYSHFYNEVLRIKELGEKINTTGNLFVVYDELFRGTNIKDAYEASVAVIEALAKIEHGVFIVSTHIVEAAEVLNMISNSQIPTISKSLTRILPSVSTKVSV